MKLVLDALQSIEDALRGMGTGFALVGGLAVSARVAPRFTEDVDLAVAVGSDAEAEALIRGLGPRGFTVLALVEQAAVNRLATVRLSPVAPDAAGIVVDLLFASSGIEPEVVRRADVLTIVPGLELPVASVGHLVALKILSRDDATRPQDASDLKRLLAQAGPSDLDEARHALELIRQRGFDRARPLQALFDEALSAIS